MRIIWTMMVSFHRKVWSGCVILPLADLNFPKRTAGSSFQMMKSMILKMISLPTKVQLEMENTAADRGAC